MSRPDSVAPLARWSLPYLGFKGLVRGALTVWCRVRYRGQEHVPERGPVLLAANHESFLDPFLIGAGLRRRPRYIVWHTYYESPWLGPPIRLLGGFPSGNSRAHGVLNAARAVLDAGQALEIFPEGERSSPGRVGPFARGFARLARVTRAPVTPIAIIGSGNSWSRDRSWPRPARVEVIFGSPMLAPADTGEPAELRHAEQQFAADVRRRIIELAGGRLVGAGPPEQGERPASA